MTQEASWRRVWAVFRHLYLIGSFFLLDLWLRYVTRKIGLYEVSELAPNLFSVCWAVILTAVVALAPSRLVGRVVYGLFYYVASVYVVVQDGYYQLMGNFLYFSDFLYAGEGSDYISYVKNIITPGFLAHIAGLLAVGAVGIALFPRPRRGNRSFAIKLLGLGLGISGLFLTPLLYGTYDADQWDSYTSPAFSYERFIHATYDMELMGCYQFAYRNTVLSLERAGILGRVQRTAQFAQIEAYFADKPAHTDNEMTGIFAGKNVIVVMMESLDDWLITPEDTPTIDYLMQNGIRFTQMYTPEYASGYTFNTEFAFNTGVYPFTNSNAAYGLAGNLFPKSIANLFRQAGYAANSYHRSNPDFYNRGFMHLAFGYETYHGFYSYSGPDVTRENDAFLVECDEVYGSMTAGEPFFSFVITYSPHLPYDETDALTQEALTLHPEYGEGGVTEVSALKAKVRLTDDMFAGLLERLETDGLMEDTVIVAFADHYAYGLSDKDFLLQVSAEAGSEILQRTPLFIYSTDGPVITVDKVMQTTDILPTLANLFGLEVPRNVMGSDVFDDAYAGYAIFPNLTWLTAQAYMENGTLVWNDGMDEDEVQEMNAFVQESYSVKDAILNSDYYRHSSGD